MLCGREADTSPFVDVNTHHDAVNLVHTERILHDHDQFLCVTGTRLGEQYTRCDIELKLRLFCLCFMMHGFTPAHDQSHAACCGDKLLFPKHFFFSQNTEACHATKALDALSMLPVINTLFFHYHIK